MKLQTNSQGNPDFLMTVTWTVLGLFTTVVLVWAFINIVSLFIANPNLDTFNITFGKIFTGTVTGLLMSLGGYTAKRCAEIKSRKQNQVEKPM
jgi:ABC-type amino acid transport system permease subunit